jgi:Na+-transporting NADH:ubiquinone oxidoreductase subunit NqrA
VTADVTDLLEEYRAGLEAEITVLRQLDDVASRQREVTETHDYDRLAVESDLRSRLTRTLVTIEDKVRQVREQLKASSGNVSGVEIFDKVAELRLTATALVNRILSMDRDSLKALGDAELARRAAVASLERGETTLSAYRKVIAPPVSNSALLDRRG